MTVRAGWEHKVGWVLLTFSLRGETKAKKVSYLAYGTQSEPLPGLFPPDAHSEMLQVPIHGVCQRKTGLSFFGLGQRPLNRQWGTEALEDCPRVSLESAAQIPCSHLHTCTQIPPRMG